MTRKRKQLKLIKLKTPRKLRNGNLVVRPLSRRGADE
jgi:hypothetical protein